MEPEKKLQEAKEMIECLEKKAKENAAKVNYLEKLFLTLEDLHIFVCKKDVNGDYIIISGEGLFTKKNNYPTKDTEKKQLQDIINTELYSSIKPYYDRAFIGETVRYRGYLYNNRYYSTTLTPLSVDQEGLITEVLGKTQDITEFYLNEIETRKKTEILENIIENNPYSIQILNSEGHHIRCNNSFLEMFKAVPDHNWSIFNDSLINSKGLSLEIEKVLNGEIVKMPPFWYNAHLIDPKYPNLSVCLGSVLFPVFINNHKLEYIVVMHEDITTKVVAEEELIKAKEKAEESDRLKSAFLANMSHEIRTPMNGILGFAELLKNPKLTDQKQAKYIRIIEQSGIRLLNIINDLINISKLESGQMDVTIMEVDINEEIRFVYNFFELEATRKGLKLQALYETTTEIIKIKTDKEKFLAIFTNLVKNAIKFTKEGHIDFGYEYKNNNYIFFVKDTGIGISENQQKVIFDRFVQADHGSQNFNEGSGLGLSIAKAYIELLGGKIWVKSEIGKGANFFFNLPQQEYKHDIEPIINVNTITNIVYPNITVLAVDDDEISLSFLSNVLEGFCKKIYLAKNGNEAIRICQKNNEINLILMDIKMPEKDGLIAAIEIKKILTGIPIIAQTAYALDLDKEKYLKTFDEYITKPIKVDDLKYKIQMIINKK